ncbi:putative bulb-type lectin domain-containing protein [Helianthus annuus]|nr:putative bulb-type lectin domain-containing protein [Helianthus annuus]
MDINQAIMLVPYITFFLMLGTSRSSDTIAVHQNNSDGQTIVSGNAKFELGFFSLGTSKNRYLGIWFKNTSSQTIVWVANRETPLTDKLGLVILDNQGNLSLVNGSGKVTWSSNSLASGTNINLVVQLLNTGNLVIKNGNATNNESFVWQSFDYPGDTYLPGMKLGKNFITGRETYLTSWRSADDPSPGEYTLRTSMVKNKYPQVYIRRNSVIVTRSGLYNGISFSGGPVITPDTTDPEYVCYMVVNQNEMYFATIADETMVNRAGLTHWSRQEGLIPSSRGSLAGSPVVDLLHKETSRDS